MRTVSSSFPAGAAIVASPSGPQRQRSCRGSLDVLRSASCGVSKLVASTRNVTLKVGLCAIPHAMRSSCSPLQPHWRAVCFLNLWPPRTMSC